MTRIPLDPIGYAIEGSVIHTRYNDHARGQRTRTEKGALTLLDGRDATVCPTCYPHPVYRVADKPRAPQKRRVQNNGATPLPRNRQRELRGTDSPAQVPEAHDSMGEA